MRLAVVSAASVVLMVSALSILFGEAAAGYVLLVWSFVFFALAMIIPEDA